MSVPLCALTVGSDAWVHFVILMLIVVPTPASALLRDDHKSPAGKLFINSPWLWEQVTSLFPARMPGSHKDRSPQDEGFFLGCSSVCTDSSAASCVRDASRLLRFRECGLGLNSDPWAAGKIVGTASSVRSVRPIGASNVIPSDDVYLDMVLRHSGLK